MTPEQIALRLMGVDHEIKVTRGIKYAQKYGYTVEQVLRFFEKESCSWYERESMFDVNYALFEIVDRMKDESLRQRSTYRGRFFRASRAAFKRRLNDGSCELGCRNVGFTTLKPKPCK